MKIQVEGARLIWLFMLVLATAVSSKVTCPFKYMHHFGDGFTDNGNSINVSPKDANPARLPPYGMTNPGWPTGRWCDGHVDFDDTVVDLDLPNIVPYLTWPTKPINDGVVFSTARSPVLPISFFESRGINVPSYAAPLATQMSWFSQYLEATHRLGQDPAKFIADSLFLMGDIESNDIGYALTQGESIEEVIKTYLPKIVEEITTYSRVLLNLGATRMIITGNIPIGCNPYILTALWTSDESAYDELGCLKSVNELILHKNNLLNEMTLQLKQEFPNTFISLANIYDTTYDLIKEASATGPDGINKALKSCCGSGGRYNYDSKRFCGSPGVPVCPNPNEYVFWDGFHFTQQMYYNAERRLVPENISGLNCTASITIRPKGASVPLSNFCKAS